MPDPGPFQQSASAALIAFVVSKMTDGKFCSQLFIALQEA